MSNIVKSAKYASGYSFGIEDFNTTIQNIGATASNTEALAASGAAIEQYTAETAENTAQILSQSIETNIKLDRSFELQSLQVQLAVQANEGLRSIDSSIRVLGQTVTEVGSELKEIGRESNTLLKHSNELLGQSLTVQTELLNTIRAEHARLEQDRKAKRLMYELKQVLDQIKKEPVPIVRAFAASLMLHRTGASSFSVNDIFEVEDKGMLDSLRTQMVEIIEGAGSDANAELLSFDEACRIYFRSLAENIERDFPPARKLRPLLPEVCLDEQLLPPFAGERAMDASLAARLNATLVSLHEKTIRARLFKTIVQVVGAFFIVISLLMLIAAPIFGLILLIFFSATLFVLLSTSMGVRMANSIFDINIDPSKENSFLDALGLSEKAAAEAIASWADYLHRAKVLKVQIARDSASVRRDNDQLRRQNSTAKDWNQRREFLLKKVQDRHRKRLSELRVTLEMFVGRYPSLRKWWTIPESPKV